MDFDDRCDSLAIALAYFVEAAAQDQMRTQAERAAQIQREDMEVWMSEQVGAIDCLALGWRPQPEPVGCLWRRQTAFRLIGTTLSSISEKSSLPASFLRVEPSEATAVTLLFLINAIASLTARCRRHADVQVSSQLRDRGSPRSCRADRSWFG